MRRPLRISLTTTAATVALTIALAGPVASQGVPTVDTQNIAQEIRQLQQMLQDFGIQTDLLDNALAQLDLLQQQFDQLEEMYASLTGPRSILGLAMGGDLDNLLQANFEDIPGLIRGIQAGDWSSLIGPNAGPLRTQMEQALASAGFDEDSLREIATSGNPGAEGVATRATTGAVMSAAAQNSHAEAAQSLERVEQLVAMIPDMEDLKASMDHNTRVTAELAIAMTRMWELEAIQTQTEIKDLGNQIASAASTTLSQKKPIVSVSILYRDRPIRAQVIQPPAVEGGFSISLRFFSSLPLEAIKLGFLYGKERSLEGLRRERNAALRDVVASGDIDAALRFCVENKLNMIVSGGTSTGKTVAARKILSLIPHEERIITIEEAAELRPEQPNAVTLIADRDTEARSADVLLASTLRMRPDRIVLGEVRGREAMTFLEAINTGHGGSLTTLHAETPQLAVRRLAIAALKTDVPMTYADMVDYIEGSIDVIIQAGRHDGARGITEFFLPGQARHPDQYTDRTGAAERAAVAAE